MTGDILKELDENAKIPEWVHDAARKLDEETAGLKTPDWVDEEVKRLNSEAKNEQETGRAEAKA
ncbi:MAG: hypothetical protein IJQ29_09500 [Synergistaceae bacterium]|nr:hypothetical protein [Synergistaceae bacterium]